MGDQEIKMISLDCSTKCTGLAIWKNNKYDSSHIINCEGIRNIDERSKEMGIEIWNALSYHKPNVVYIEDTYCHGNPETQKKLNRIQGVVYAWCITHGADFNCIMPSAWRKYIPDFPNGRSKRDEHKAFSKKYVAKHYGFDPATDDQSDAILIGEGAIRMNEQKDR